MLTMDAGIIGVGTIGASNSINLFNSVEVRVTRPTANFIPSCIELQMNKDAENERWKFDKKNSSVSPRNAAEF
jgi:hypothetical protein